MVPWKTNLHEIIGLRFPYPAGSDFSAEWSGLPGPRAKSRELESQADVDKFPWCCKYNILQERVN